MRVFLWRAARLRESSESINKSTELLLDLVFAQAVRSVGQLLRIDSLHADSPWSKASLDIDYMVMFFPFWWLSYAMMLFSNRFYTESVFHNLHFLAQCIATLGAGVNACYCLASAPPAAGGDGTAGGSRGLQCFNVLRMPVDQATAVSYTHLTLPTTPYV